MNMVKKQQQQQRKTTPEIFFEIYCLSKELSIHLWVISGNLEDAQWARHPENTVASERSGPSTQPWASRKPSSTERPGKTCSPLISGGSSVKWEQSAVKMNIMYGKHKVCNKHPKNLQMIMIPPFPLTTWSRKKAGGRRPPLWRVKHLFQQSSVLSEEVYTLCYFLLNKKYFPTYIYFVMCYSMKTNSTSFIKSVVGSNQSIDVYACAS